MLNTALQGELFPCPFEDQHLMKGICHGIGTTRCGRPYAILEYKNGDIVIKKLDKKYSIQLIREKP
jgi:hypothetical protein